MPSPETSQNPTSPEQHSQFLEGVVERIVDGAHLMDKIAEDNKALEALLDTESAQDTIDQLIDDYNALDESDREGIDDVDYILDKGKGLLSDEFLAAFEHNIELTDEFDRVTATIDTDLQEQRLTVDELKEASAKAEDLLVAEAS